MTSVALFITLEKAEDIWALEIPGNRMASDSVAKRRYRLVFILGILPFNDITKPFPLKQIVHIYSLPVSEQ
jgi:hypothetical protein